MVLYIICTVLLLGYVALMMVYRAGWLKQPIFVVDDNYAPNTTITVVIAARNEAQNIAQCVNAILNQHYPASLFDVVVVDDHSTDGTANIVESYSDARVMCIALADEVDCTEEIRSYKKRAIAAGIARSRGQLVITTDADCIAPPRWLAQVARMYERDQPVMIVAPVDFTNNASVLQLFQSLDFMSMQGITAASHYMNMGNMCNGANLAFSRVAYDAVGGYGGIDHIASGDDYLLMMKLQKAHKGKVAYLKSTEAIVTTPPQQDWKGFYMQRVRWASKSGKYDDKKMTAVLSFVYLFNFSFVVMFLTGIFSHNYLWLLLACAVVKFFCEIVYLYPVARFFSKTRQLLIFPFLQPLHILYIVLVGFAGFAGKYEWKGRTIN